MRFKRSKDNKLEFRKKDKLHNFKTKAMIQHFMDEIVGEKKKEESDDDGSDSDSDSYYSSSDSDSGKKRKRKRS